MEGYRMGLLTYFQIKEDVLIVRLSGEIDHHEAKIFRESWQRQLTKSHIKHVILNMEDVTFMDSSGIGVILGRYKEVVQLGGELIICSLQPAIKRMFELSGL